MYLIRNFFLAILIMFAFVSTIVNAETKKFNMVFVPASEKGDENDFKGLIEIVNKLTGFEINFIKVTDYNAAVEAMRADRAQIAWYGGKTYIKAAELASAAAFAAGVRPGEKDAGYFSYFVVKKDSSLKKFSDIKGKILSLNSMLKYGCFTFSCSLFEMYDVMGAIWRHMIPFGGFIFSHQTLPCPYKTHDAHYPFGAT